MKGKNIIALLGLIGTISLSGCDSREQSRHIEINGTDYFAEISPCYGESSPSIISGDFDGDGDLDFICAQQDVNGNNQTRFYYFENDGRGHFTLRRNNSR